MRYAARTLRWLVPLVLVCACKSEPKRSEDPAKTVAPAKPASVLDRYPIRPHTTSTAREETDGTVKTSRHEEKWTRTAEDPPQWTCVAKDGDDDKQSGTTKYRLTDEGLVHEAYVLGDKTLTITPPKIQIPSDPKVGKKWSAQHVSGNKKHDRSCEITALDTCADGIVVTCVTTYENKRVTTLSNRYCGGVGYVGSSGVIKNPDGTTTKSSDEDVKAAD